MYKKRKILYDRMIFYNQYYCLEKCKNPTKDTLDFIQCVRKRMVDMKFY